MKVLSVVGARPNFVKMAPVINRILDAGLEHRLLHTGQHYDEKMSGIFLEELGLPELDHYLEVGSGSHGQQTGKMLIEIEKVLLLEKPDVVLVPGDTNTTLAGALAAAKLHIPVGHIEAGLRSFDRRMPEEINRILVDHCSEFLFCPTKTGADQLEKEGIPANRIFLVGDPMMEACKEFMEKAGKMDYSKKHGIDEPYYLATVHRAENTDEKKRLSGIMEAFQKSKHRIIFPAHPRTVKQLKEFGLWEKIEKAPNLDVVEPVGYLEFLYLLSRARLMLTDSGGVQKEAFFLGIPCVTLRDNTEWVETVSAGGNILAGADSEKILESIGEMLKKAKAEDLGAAEHDGASERIVNVLLDRLGA